MKHTDVLARLDGAVLRAWVTRAVERLHVRRAELDELNVFPVADSDTGTNLYLTLRGGLESVGDEPADASPRAVGPAPRAGRARRCRRGSGEVGQARRSKAVDAEAESVGSLRHGRSRRR